MEELLLLEKSGYFYKLTASFYFTLIFFFYMIFLKAMECSRYG